MALFGSAVHTAAAVTTSAVLLGQPFPNRTNIVIYNNSNTVTLFVGTLGVTVATGYPVLPQSSISLDFGPQIAVYGICTSTVDARCLEAY